MDSKNGKDYKQNYDFIVKWMAAVLRGETPDFISADIGRIAEVFAFEPTDISVRAGRVDIMVRNTAGGLFHIEEQRNLSKADMYRFAAYHFPAAEQWGDKLTDIIIASGDVYSGANSQKTISTSSGSYTPIVIDLSGRDGWKRLDVIRAAVKENDLSGLAELVFIPLYGKEKGDARSKLAIEVIKFEKALLDAKVMDIKFLAATLIIANKMIDKEKLNKLWEVIKMLDIIELAEEKGMEKGMEKGRKKGREEGREEGLQKGRQESAQEMVLDTIFDVFGNLPVEMIEKVKSITHFDILKMIHRQALKCKDIEQFRDILNQSTTS